MNLLQCPHGVHPKSCVRCNDPPAPAAPDVAKAVEEIRFHARQRLNGGGRVPSIAELEEWASLLAKLGQGWIPVSERLPEDDITVLFYDADGVVNKGARRHFNHDIAWIADDDVDGMPHLGVTHWMPLPPAFGASDE